MLSPAPTYSHEPHKPRKYRTLPWLVCRCCGLVYLKNDVTASALKLGCNWAEHPSVVAERATRSRS